MMSLRHPESVPEFVEVSPGYRDCSDDQHDAKQEQVALLLNARQNDSDAWQITLGV